MKKVTVLTLFLSVVLSLHSFGQRREHFRGNEPGSGPERGERVKAIKIGMITDELKLSEAQAEKFWPVYNAYDSERMSLHRQIREKTRNASNSTASDDEVLKRQDEVLALKEKEIDLVKQYRGSFLKVISTKQYADLLETERRFNQMLMEKLKERGKN